eukprot:scaffold51495_cov38-Cyclotella_meneghiniana.AAC.6
MGKVFLHLQYHPNDSQSRDIQRIWREQILQPEGEMPLPEMENVTGDRVDSLYVTLTVGGSQSQNTWHSGADFPLFLECAGPAHCSHHLGDVNK